MRLIAFIFLLFSLALGEVIDYGDNQEDGYISYANITAKSSSNSTLLYDTEINFDSVILLPLLSCSFHGYIKAVHYINAISQEY